MFNPSTCILVHGVWMNLILFSPKCIFTLSFNYQIMIAPPRMIDRNLTPLLYPYWVFLEVPKIISANQLICCSY